MIEIGVDSKTIEHVYTSDAEQIFLLHTVLPVAAIELVSDRTVEFRVHVEVRIKQIELHSPYVDAPYMAVDYTAGIRHFEYHRLAVLAHDGLDRKLVEVLGLIVGDLLSVDRKRLREITVTVEKTYRSHGHAAVRSLLDIVAGKHTEAT